MVFFYGRISLAALVLLTCAAARPIAAQTAPARGAASLQAGADNVVLDLAVRDRRNKPVLDLRPEEIRIQTTAHRFS